jgi:hypothetical protein
LTNYENNSKNIEETKGSKNHARKYNPDMLVLSMKTARRKLRGLDRIETLSPLFALAPL